MYGFLDGEDVPWEAGEVFQVDERIAPEGDGDRNLTHLRAGLPPAALDRLRPMPVEAAGEGGEVAEEASARYESALPEALDLVHLGLGPDGHTASLVPGDAVLDVTDRRVALTASEYQGHRRMTLTYPALAAARQVLWLVTGEEKRDALAGLRAADPSIPGGRVWQEHAVLLCDRAALGPAGTA